MHVLALTFLDPATGIIAASIATPALLLLYFLRLRRRPLRISSTLLWERAAQDLQVNAPFQWIRPSWLLLLQLIILAALCLALARPTVERPTHQSDRVALIIDASASMRAPDAGAEGSSRTRFDAARERARELIARLPASTEIMLIASAAEAETIAPFSRDRGMLRGALDALEPVDQPGNMAAALSLVSAAGAQSSAEDVPTAPLRAILITDAGFAGAETPPSAGRASVELLRVGPDPGGPRDNLAILSLAAKRDYDDPTLVRLFLRAASWRAEPTTATVRIDLDGRELSLQTLDIPARDDAGPGQVSVTLPLTAPAPSLVSVALLEDDLLPADNIAALRLGEASGPRVLLVQPDAPRYDADFALIEVVRAIGVTDLTRMTAPEFDALPPEAAPFREHDMVILDRVLPARLPPLPSLSFDATLPIPGLTMVEGEQRGDRFAIWNRTHPALRYASLGDPKISAPMTLTVPEAGVRTDDGVVRTEVLASGERGPLMVLLEQGPIRRIVVAFSLRRTNWWAHESFPIFMANTVEYLTASGRAGTGVALTTTEPIVFPAPPGAEAVATGPDRFVRRTVASAEGVARFGSIPNVGIYTLRIGGQPAGAFATTLINETESALATGDEILVNGQVVAAGDFSEMAPREIRDWFIALAIVLLALEWMLFGWKMRV